jgi:2-dehydropantoate 2-reductase
MPYRRHRDLNPGHFLGDVWHPYLSLDQYSTSIFPATVATGERSSLLQQGQADFMWRDTFVRVLVVGAGAIGGYFGGRLLQAGNSVTFLVRRRRARELAAYGLVIRSPYGDAFLKDPPIVLADEIDHTYDLVLLSCRSYDLSDAIQSLIPAVGPQTVILPLVNGMRHLEMLDAQFGTELVLGGLCTIRVSMNEQCEVVQSQSTQSLLFGERDGRISGRSQEIARLIETGRFNGALSGNILQEMWEKWVFLASLAASTSLMRSTISNIVAASGGKEFMEALIRECVALAGAHGYPPRRCFLEQKISLLTARDSNITTSVFRDMQAGLQVEVDHVIGDLITRAETAGVPVPLLRVAHTHLKVYELDSQEERLDE